MMRDTDLVTDLNDAPALPRLQEGQGRALNRLYNDAPPTPVVCASISGELRFSFFESSPPGMEAWCHHRFTLGPHAGSLMIDDAGMALLLRETRVDQLPGELRTVLLADALHPVVEALKTALRMRFEWIPSDAPASVAQHEEAVGFELRARDGSIAVRGLARLDDGAAMALMVPAFTRRRSTSIEHFDLLRMPLRFELGSAQICLKEIRQIRTGDVIGIDRWASRGTALHVTARVGGRTGVLLTGLADESHITLIAVGGTAMNRDDLSTSDVPIVDDPTGLPLARLDALEVVLRFEVGELSLSLGELKSLGPGHVFDLAEPLNRSNVRILAHGNVLGKGYLVAVGDRLGVRVSQFAPSEL